MDTTGRPWMTPRRMPRGSTGVRPAGQREPELSHSKFPEAGGCRRGHRPPTAPEAPAQPEQETKKLPEAQPEGRKSRTPRTPTFKDKRVLAGVAGPQQRAGARWVEEARWADWALVA